MIQELFTLLKNCIIISNTSHIRPNILYIIQKFWIFLEVLTLLHESFYIFQNCPLHNSSMTNKYNILSLYLTLAQFTVRNIYQNFAKQFQNGLKYNLYSLIINEFSSVIISIKYIYLMLISYLPFRAVNHFNMLKYYG